MSDEKFVELQDRHGDDFIALVSGHSELRLSNYEIVKALNSFNTTCDTNQKLIAQQEERIAGQLKALEVAGRCIAQLEEVESEMKKDIELLRDELKKFLPKTFDEDGREDPDNSHGDFMYNEGSEEMGLSVIAILAVT